VSFYNARVERTDEFTRIWNIPRRVWTQAETDEAVRRMTDALKLPHGTMELFPIQAKALTEIGLYGGLLGPIPVGEGKTLISLLAPYVLEAKRPVLLLPAGLIEKTQREMLDLFKHWRIPRNIRMISIESLGRVGQANVLEAYTPDLIVIDEAHRVKNKKAGVVRRLVRRHDANPNTRFVIMSGTMAKDGLDDFEHLSSWTLKERSPLPDNKGELLKWADVLDKSRDLRRTDPGVLLELCNEEEAKRPRFEAARLGFNRRLNETPGVISSQGAEVGASIYLSAVTFSPKAVTNDNFRKLRSEWKTPDDWALMQAVDVWRHACELVCGLHYVWDPRPPEAWRMARSDWNKFVRDTLARSHSLDTPHQVELAVRDGEVPGGALYLQAWKDQEPTFKPNSKPVWHDTSCLDVCQAWGEKAPGIIWTEHSFFGKELARRAGWEYFGRDGVNAAGVPIDLRKAKHEGKTIVASRKANATGRNLQAWSRNLVVSLPGCDLEQLIGRTHRPGQEADVIQVDIILACAEHLAAWESALLGAKMVRDMLGQKQKVLLADKVVDTRQFSVLQEPRWVKTLSEKDSKFVLPVI